MTIQAIIKNAIKRLELEGKILTPDFYAEAFCKEAQKAGMQVEDCNHVEKLSATLNKEFAKELANYRIKTMHELVRFLISKLNRTNSSSCSEMVDAQNVFLRRVLQVVEVLHNKEASELAKKSLELLDAHPNTAQLEQFRQSWVNFITLYDDSFLKLLRPLGDVDTSDLKKSIQNLHISTPVISNQVSQQDLEKISSYLISSFVPSIASSVNDEIASLSERIKKNPELLQTQGLESEIKAIISLRIALDKQSVTEMIQALDGVLDKLSLRLINMIEQSDNSTVEIQTIKRELESYATESITNFKVAHQKLFTIAVALEENTQLFSKSLQSHSQEVQQLSDKISQLEDELQKVRMESKEDYLTKLYNKRALDEFLALKEAEFARYNHNYAIVMFDLDFFKKINDSFGHEAGDAVLSAFAKILKKECRSVDIVGRYGGEEFMGILSETDTKGGAIFAEKVRQHVEKSRFMYKGERIEVTVSAGVSERVKHASCQNVINSADEYLYKAKKDGRNQVAYKK